MDAGGNPVVEYAWGLLGPIARLDLTNSANNRYYILDALGHTRLLLDNTGNVTDRYTFDAWGNLIEQTGNTPNPFTWNGAYGYEWLEFTGLYHVGAREYDPRTARWLQRDPIGVGGGDPNLYRYCFNDPLSFTDPSGMDFGDWWKGVSEWYMRGMGGLSQWVDRTLMGGSTENFGRTVGEYDCGQASGWDVTFSGLKWGGGMLLLSTGGATTVKVVASSGKALLAATTGAVVTQGGKKQVFKLVSRIKESTSLVKHAEKAGKSVQKDLDHLVEMMSKGNIHAGTGAHPIQGCKGVLEARARSGARVYFRQTGDTIEILAKSSKDNQKEVIKVLQRMYGN